MVNLGNEWDNLLKQEFEKEYYTDLRKFLVNEYNNYKIYPPANDLFNALKYTSYSDVKVVILGQDPYHGEGQAHGLCFSVKKGVTPPPSLKNMFKEIKDESDVHLIISHVHEFKSPSVPNIWIFIFWDFELMKFITLPSIS